MSTKPEELLRQQYLVPRRSVDKLRAMSRREGVSAGELARRAIEAYTAEGPAPQTEEEVAAEALLQEIHSKVRLTLRKMDENLQDIRKRESALADGSFQARTRTEIKAWLEAHPEDIEAAREVFFPEVTA